MSVTKEEVKRFIRLVRLEMDARYAKTYALVSQVVALKNEIEQATGTEIDTSQFVAAEDGKGLSTEDFTTEEKALLSQLANDSSTEFTDADLADVFS